ncbi:uncharacterized protein LOC121984235 isoform X1 [Zingiber officinale]|uniref:uncharacterized protein LOC121984235 isoform X1 n=1 Tax=Zingiber officinale TaxID=94328 RepID=UPI001C4BEAA5|nr:uncharacterized protein LOC121984235 isoform X1 [Zingiber officinale]
MSNQSVVNCPLCTEEMDSTDLQLKPCKCGYQICVWCWNHIIQTAENNDTEGRCPACRTLYDKERILKVAISTESLAKQVSQRQKSQKAKSKPLELPKDVNDVRVIRRNLVYVSGVPVALADEMILKKREYFAQYGKIVRVVVVPPSEAFLNFRVIYITFSKEDEALKCIEAVDGFILDGNPLKACFGTTRYCHDWLKNGRCKKQNCLYMHDACPEEDICTKDEAPSVCTSKLQKSSGYVSNLPPRSGRILPPPMNTLCRSSSTVKKDQKHCDNGRKITEKDDRKHGALLSTASWESTSTSGRLSYASVTALKGPINHSAVPKNFIMKPNDRDRVCAVFQNTDQSDEQLSTSNSIKVGNRLVKSYESFEHHTSTELAEHKRFQNFSASDQASIVLERTEGGLYSDNFYNKFQKIREVPITMNFNTLSHLPRVASRNDFMRCPRMDTTDLNAYHVFSSSVNSSNQGQNNVCRVRSGSTSADFLVTSSLQDAPISNLQAVSHSSYQERLSGCLNSNLTESFIKSNSSIGYGNRYSISTKITGNSKISSCGAFAHSAFSDVGISSFPHNQGKLQKESSASEDFVSGSSQHESDRSFFLGESNIYRNVTDLLEDSKLSDEAGKCWEDYDMVSDMLSLNLDHVDHIVGPLANCADYVKDDYPFICETEASFNPSMNHDMLKPGFTDSSILNVENYIFQGNLQENNATHLYTHSNKGLSVPHFSECMSLSAKSQDHHNVSFDEMSNESNILFSSYQSGSTSKLKGSQFSAFPALVRSIPDIPTDVADYSNPQYYATKQFSGGNMLQSSQLISPDCGSSTVGFAKGNQLPELRNLSEKSVILANKNRSAILDSTYQQNVMNDYDFLWGPRTVDNYTARESMDTKGNLSDILNRFLPGSKYQPPK